jgi:5-methylcytosine-specific restriction protein B
MAQIDENTLVEEGAIPPEDFHNHIERIREVSDYELEVWVDPVALQEILAAVQVGHVVLQGPPGTGKSTMARALCTALGVSVFPVTAHEDWTVFDVVGRLELAITAERKEEIRPVNGFFTEAVIRCANSIVRHFDEPDEPQAEWLLIDELNRAHLDKAFGELFTVLGTDDLVPITLPHQKPGNRDLVIPRRFRIIATLNSVDRQFVNSLSQGLRRRFTFVTLDIPRRRSSAEQWTESGSASSLAVKEFHVVLRKAAARVARRLTSLDPTKADAKQKELAAKLGKELIAPMKQLFDFIERIRYVGPSDDSPHLPLGTAQLIDTAELFLTRVVQEKIPSQKAAFIIDWAVAIKIAPLFDADIVAPELLKEFANELQPPFNEATRRELLRIVAAGMHFVD